MKRNVGPLDKRRTTTRCQSCAKRRIKCEGGFPCEYCTRTDKTCQPQRAASREVKFVCVVRPMQPCRTGLPLQLNDHADTIYLDLFASLIQRCQFTRGFVSVTADLLPLIQTSTSLQNLARAIGALEASRRSSVSSSQGQDSPQYIAFDYYGRAMQTLQSELKVDNALRREDVLWATFLLGFFELISESSGERWAKHMLYGTSRMLQAAGPAAFVTPLSGKLFEAFFFLETNRAILYGDDTFLSHDAWQSRLRRVSGPMGADLELMLRTSSFSKRFFDVIEDIPGPLRPAHPSIKLLAKEGIEIQAQLDAWHSNFSLNGFNHPGPHSDLALANNHSLLLFLCRNYRFYSCWQGSKIPILSPENIESRVCTILDLAESILEANSNLPGVLLLFPLRMAGANSGRTFQKHKILNLLARVHSSGFIVSERIKLDLQQLWEYEASRQGQM